MKKAKIKKIYYNFQQRPLKHRAFCKIVSILGIDKCINIRNFFNNEIKKIDLRKVEWEAMVKIQNVCMNVWNKIKKPRILLLSIASNILLVDVRNIEQASRNE